jgi:hypothetical protein
MNSWNSTRHGLLSKVLPSIYGQHKRQFTRLLTSLRQDLQPVGTLEEVLVEKIAQEYWRLGVAAEHEADEFARPNPFVREPIDKILRYQTTINRQLQSLELVDGLIGSDFARVTMYPTCRYCATPRQSRKTRTPIDKCDPANVETVLDSHQWSCDLLPAEIGIGRLAYQLFSAEWTAGFPCLPR